MTSRDSIPARQNPDSVPPAPVKHTPLPAAEAVSASPAKTSESSAKTSASPAGLPVSTVQASAEGLPAPTDSVAADTVVAEHEYGVILTPPERPSAVRREGGSDGLSYIFGGLLLLFCIIGMRFHNSRKYVAAMLRDLVTVKMRSNVFDETVRETSFLVLLNLMWSCSAGVLLYGLLCLTVPSNPQNSFGLAALADNRAASVAVCMGMGIVYTAFMSVAYYMVGSVFSDGRHARTWLKGYTASQGLLSFIYLPLALLLLCCPEWTEIVLWIGLGFLVLSKIVFIWKGFRIFFTQISSWLLFLYYLCSLEIVPLILTYLAALWLCSLLP